MLHPEEPLADYEERQRWIRNHSMPNLAALDAELTARIRRLVHQELAPLVEAEVERKLKERFPWLKAPEKTLPDGARKE